MVPTWNFRNVGPAACRHQEPLRRDLLAVDRHLIFSRDHRPAIESFSAAFFQEIGVNAVQSLNFTIFIG